VGIFISFFLRGIVSGAINRTGIGRRAKSTGGNIGKSVGKAFFWLAIALGLQLQLDLKVQFRAFLAKSFLF